MACLVATPSDLWNPKLLRAALDPEVEETDPAEPCHEEDDGDVAARV